MHTTNPARTMGLRYETGLSADFVILDRDLCDVPVEQIHDTLVRQTWFAGRLVHGTSNTDLRDQR